MRTCDLSGTTGKNTHTLVFFFKLEESSQKRVEQTQIEEYFGVNFFLFFAAFLLENTLILECVCPLIATRTKVMRRVLVSILAVDCWETPTGWEEKACMFTSLKIWPFFLPFGSFWPFPKLDSPKKINISPKVGRCVGLFGGPVTHPKNPTS